jgi:hypothetical protein
MLNETRYILAVYVNCFDAERHYAKKYEHSVAPEAVPVPVVDDDGED